MTDLLPANAIIPEKQFYGFQVGLFFSLYIFFFPHCMNFDHLWQKYFLQAENLCDQIYQSINPDNYLVTKITQ